MADKKYTLTAPRKSTEELALLKLEETLGVFNQLLAKLDADTGVTDTDYADLTAQVKSIREQILGTLGNL